MSIYCVSDLHGRYDLYQQIKKFLKPSDKVICLGDCGDRGLDSWKTILAVYEDPQFEYLLGNHEHLFARAILQYDNKDPEYYENALQDCIDNGGLSTFKSWKESGADIEWATKLLNLSTTYFYKNESGISIILSHAGLTPGKESYSIHDLIWDRKHMYTDWPDGYKDVLIVHGHTPVQLLDPSTTDAMWYCQDHKVDIDCGSAWSGRTCLFDLDTFDEHYFQGDVKE